MTPLRIEFTLVGAVERPHRPIHLDALIAARLCERDAPDGAEIAQIRALIDDLPLERETIGGDWVWKASTIAFEWTSPPMQEFATRAVRADKMHEIQQTGLFSNVGTGTSIDTSRGMFKSAVWAHEIQHARRAVAYCVGDRKAVEELIGGIEQIGARRRYGNGRVSAVAVVEDADAHEMWKRRHLPYASGLGTPVEGAYRLPLWDRANQVVIRDNHLELAPIAA